MFNKLMLHVQLNAVEWGVRHWSRRIEKNREEEGELRQRVAEGQRILQENGRPTYPLKSRNFCNTCRFWAVEENDEFWGECERQSEPSPLFSSPLLRTHGLFGCAHWKSRAGD